MTKLRLGASWQEATGIKAAHSCREQPRAQSIPGRDRLEPPSGAGAGRERSGEGPGSPQGIDNGPLEAQRRGGRCCGLQG